MSFEIVVRKMPKQKKKKFALSKQICRKVSLVAVLSNLAHLSSISNTFDFIQERSNIIHNELNGSEVFTATLVSVAIEGVLHHKPIRLLIHEFTEKNTQQIHVSVLRVICIILFSFDESRIYESGALQNLLSYATLHCFSNLKLLQISMLVVFLVFLILFMNVNRISIYLIKKNHECWQICLLSLYFLASSFDSIISSSDTVVTSPQH